MKIEITSLVGRIPVNERKTVFSMIKRAAKYFKISQGEISVVFMPESQIKKINRNYRQLDRPTTTLSFVALPLQPGRSYNRQIQKAVPQNTVIHFGEILLCRSEIKKYSTQSDMNYSRALQSLVLHSFLHCLGYEHDTRQAEKQMQSVAKKILV